MMPLLGGWNSIIWLTQERAVGVISHTQLPNKVEKNAENLILKIEGRKSVYMFSGPSLWSLTKRMVVKLPGLGLLSTLSDKVTLPLESG